MRSYISQGVLVLPLDYCCNDKLTNATTNSPLLKRGAYRDKISMYI